MPFVIQDYLGGWKTLHRVCQISELSLHLDRREPSGRVEASQGPCLRWPSRPPFVSDP